MKAKIKIWKHDSFPHLHSSEGDPSAGLSYAPIMEVDRVSERQNDGHSGEIRFRKACLQFEKEHGKRAPNDYRHEITLEDLAFLRRFYPQEYKKLVGQAKPSGFGCRKKKKTCNLSGVPA